MYYFNLFSMPPFKGWNLIVHIDTSECFPYIKLTIITTFPFSQKRENSNTSFPSDKLVFQRWEIFYLKDHSNG